MNGSSLLSVGYYPELLQLRGQLLRQNGYIVHDAASLQAAIVFARNQGAAVHLLLFCHSVPPAHQAQIMAELLRSHDVPALSICRLEEGPEVPGIPVGFSPESLLSEVRQALGTQRLRERDGRKPA